MQHAGKDIINQKLIGDIMLLAVTELSLFQQHNGNHKVVTELLLNEIYVIEQIRKSLKQLTTGCWGKPL